LSLKQDSTHLHYRTIKPIAQPLTPPSTSKADDEDEETEALLRRYLNLTPDLTSLYEQWSSVDANFNKRAPKFTGVRILKQDAWEALVGFICSSNNNIVRISQMVTPPVPSKSPITNNSPGTQPLYKLWASYWLHR
jgi:N-glycosylase/DNA lyase